MDRDTNQELPKFTPIKSVVMHVGRRIKSSKIRYTWEFKLESGRYSIDLLVSRFSGKRRILVNGNLHANEKRSKSFLSGYIFKIGNYKIEIKEIQDNRFEMTIDGKSFQTEYELADFESSHKLESIEVKHISRSHEKQEEPLSDIIEKKVRQHNFAPKIQEKKVDTDCDLLDFSVPATNPIIRNKYN